MNEDVQDEAYVDCCFDVVPAILGNDFKAKSIWDNDRLVDDEE